MADVSLLDVSASASSLRLTFFRPSTRFLSRDGSRFLPWLGLLRLGILELNQEQLRYRLIYRETLDLA